MGYIFHSKLKAVKFCLLIAISIQITILSPLKTASLETPEPDWSWSSGTPVVAASNPTSEVVYNFCPYHYQMKDVYGESDPKKVCLRSDEGVKLGNYFSSNRFAPVIGFNYDRQMYPLAGTCYYYDSCIYLQDSDTLITKDYYQNSYFRSFIVYKNFTKRLERTTNARMQTTGYYFDSSNPDFVFKSSFGHAWSVGGFGASNNDKWVAVEFLNNSIGLFDVEAFEMKYVSDFRFRYGLGRDVTSEIAVSNDGQSIALIGMNAGFNFINANKACVQNITDGNLYDNWLIDHGCKTVSINTEIFINRFATAYHPLFDDDGGELSFYATSDQNKSFEISLQASGYASRKLDYLALGDSYSSGEGETDDKYYLAHTNDEFEKCHLSFRSYPFLITDWMGVAPIDMASVACSGAETSDITGNDWQYLGQWNRLGENGLNLNDTELPIYQTDAKNNFIPGRIHQESFVQKYKPKVITIGIGGNDIGFAQKLQACIGKDICDWADTSEGRKKAANEIKSLFPVLIKTYQRLHEASPSSKIYAIGYPKIIDADNKCSLINGYILDSVERKFISESVTYLNQVVEAAAKSVGIKYVSIENSYGSHVLCGTAKPTAVSAIRLGDDISVIGGASWFKPIGSESFHPNSYGHTYASNSIMSLDKNLLDYDYCSDGKVICPDNNIVAPEPSAYWIPEGSHDYVQQKNTEFVFGDIDNLNKSNRQITLDKYSLEPNSTVEIKVKSEPRSLGQYLVDNDGSLDIDVTLPSDLEYGYHTVYLSGTSYSGEPVEFYQVIAYAQPKNNNFRHETKPTTPTISIPDVAIDNRQSDNQIVTEKTGLVKGVSVSSDEFLKTETKDSETDAANKTNFPSELIALIISFSVLIFLLLHKFKV